MIGHSAVLRSLEAVNSMAKRLRSGECLGKSIFGEPRSPDSQTRLTVMRPNATQCVAKRGGLSQEYCRRRPGASGASKYK